MTLIIKNHRNIEVSVETIDDLEAITIAFEETRDHLCKEMMSADETLARRAEQISDNLENVILPRMIKDIEDAYQQFEQIEARHAKATRIMSRVKAF